MKMAAAEALYSTTNGDARKASMTALATFFQSQLTGTGFQTLRAAPALNGYNVDASPTIAGSNVWLLLKQPGVAKVLNLCVDPMNATLFSVGRRA